MDMFFFAPVVLLVKSGYRPYCRFLEIPKPKDSNASSNVTNNMVRAGTMFLCISTETIKNGKLIETHQAIAALVG